jgi:ribosomal protein S17
MNLNIKHPKYYKELRKRNKLDQAISESKTVDIGDSVRPGPGLKQRRLTKKEERIGWITRGHDE